MSSSIAPLLTNLHQNLWIGINIAWISHLDSTMSTTSIVHTHILSNFCHHNLLISIPLLYLFDIVKLPIIKVLNYRKNRKTCSYTNYSITEKGLCEKSVLEFYNRPDTVVFHFYTIHITTVWIRHWYHSAYENTTPNILSFIHDHASSWAIYHISSISIFYA